jgi:transposase
MPRGGSPDGGIPLFLRVADGNEADQATFAKLLAEFKMRLKFDALFVADSAPYSANDLAALNHLRWLCRVPQMIKEAKTLLEKIPEESFITESAPETYRLAETKSEYGGAKQRWVVVESPERQKGQNERLEKKLEEVDEWLERRWWQLRRERFNCQAEARKALQSFAENLGDYHLLTEGELIPVRSYQKPSRPSKGNQAEVVGYRLEANLARDEQAIAVARRRSGRFILATNVRANLNPST